MCVKFFENIPMVDELQSQQEVLRNYKQMDYM